MNDDLAEFRIRQAFALYVKDGTETHGVIDSALGPVRELKTFTTIRGSIRRAIEREYRGAVHIDDVVETILKLIEDGRLP